MFQSKLTKAVAALNAWELRHLQDYVHSPFCNKNEKVTRLFDRLIALAPDFSADQLDRKLIFAAVFGDIPFHAQKFKDLLSLCMKTLRGFLAAFHLRNDEVATGMALLETLRDRGWDSEFNKASQQTEKALTRNDDKVHVKRLKAVLLEETRINYASTQHDRQAEDPLQAFSEALDTFYLLAKLKYGVEMVNRQNVVTQEFDFGFLHRVLAHLQANPDLLETYPPLRIYYLIYQCVNAEDQEAFSALIIALQAHAKSFSKHERRELYTYATNFCIQQFNKGRAAYLTTLLDIYKWALQDETFLEEGWLSHWNYKNIVSASLKAGEFAWCAAFIEDFKPKVEPGVRENAYTYNLACLHFEQQDYRQALRLLQHVEFQDVFYHLGAKVMLLKSFYELQDEAALSSLCDSFRIYLKRNTTLSEYHYTVNYNLVTFTRKLADLRRKLPLLRREAGQKKLVALREKLEAGKQVAQLAWLRKKLDALEN